MAREIGTFPISGNFEVQKAATFDARQSVDNFADLLNFTSANFIINAFPVSVKGVATPSERGLYICNDKDNLDLAASWTKLGVGETLTFLNGLVKDADGNVRLGGEFETSVSNAFFNTRMTFDLLSFGLSFNSNAGSQFNGIVFDILGLSFSTDKCQVNLLSGDLFIRDNSTGSEKKGLKLYGFGETNNDTGAGADYSTLVGTSLVNKKFVEDITGLLTALNTTNKTSLVAAINEVLAAGGGGGLTIPEIVTGLDAITTDADKLNYFSLKNRPSVYTDAKARAAQASLLTTGTSILFDRPRYYGYPTAVSGNITFDFTGAVNGQAQHIRVNASTKPTLPSSIRLLAGGFVPDVINDYYLTPWLISSSPDVWVVHVTISQENDY